MPKASKTTEEQREHSPLVHAGAYAGLSLVFLFIAIGVGWWVMDRATTLGPRFEYAYYGAVVVLALSVSIVLFGAMRSFARISGQYGAVKGDVGGPAALFVVVVVGAFALGRPAQSFSLTLRLQGSGLDPTVLNDTRVTLDLGERREVRTFSPSGEAVIAQVSNSMVGQKIRISLSSERVRLVYPESRPTIPDEHVIDLEVIVSPPPDPHRVEALQHIRDVRKQIRMTMIEHNERLTPAFEDFKRSPTKANWAVVQAAATRLRQVIREGVDAPPRCLFSICRNRILVPTTN